MKTLKPRSLGEFVDAVDRLDRSDSGPLWYRGVSKLSYKLLPSIYRPRSRSDPTLSLSELERHLVNRFRERSIPYQTHPLGTDQFETLFLMQHFTVPTRLLDWTENPFFALFFALRHAPSQSDNRGVRYTRDAAVWALDASAWNQAALKHQSYDGGPLDPSHEALGGYRTIGQIDDLAPTPVALYGAHTSSRIVAQQGTFVLFGRDTRPMEALASTAMFPERCLTRLVLTRGVIRELRPALFRHGITEAALFPDLEGLARDLKHTYGYSL